MTDSASFQFQVSVPYDLGALPNENLGLEKFLITAASVSYTDMTYVFVNEAGDIVAMTPPGSTVIRTDAIAPDNSPATG